MSAYNELKPPPQVRNQPANEVMRAAVFDGALHISLQRGFPDPATWGHLFVDAARHVARAYAHENICTEQDAFERIRASFEEAVRQPAEGVSATAPFDPKAS